MSPAHIPPEGGGELGRRRELEGLMESGNCHFFQRKQLTAMEDAYDKHD